MGKHTVVTKLTPEAELLLQQARDCTIDPLVKSRISDLLRWNTELPYRQIAMEASQHIMNVCNREWNEPGGYDPLCMGDRTTEIILKAIQDAYPES